VRRSIVLLVAAGLLAGCGPSDHSGHPSGPAGQSGRPTGPAGSSELPAVAVTSASWRDGAQLAPPIGCTPTDPGHSPAVSWSPGPGGTTSYAVTITDTDAGFLHWAVLGLPPTVHSLAAGASPGGQLPAGARELANSFGKAGYGGPCPPRGARHHYVLTVWAVRGDASTVAEVQRAAIASGTLTATYTH
jgi:Raf kinase inhibitor-like YbhB/YbcL family protein